MAVDHINKQRHPQIIELVGPAGAGKSSLVRLLSQRNNHLASGADIALRQPGQLLRFSTTAPRLLPLLLQAGQAGRRFTWNEIKALIYLQGWHRIYIQQARRQGGIVLLDHGPVFKLATLQAFGPERLHGPVGLAWWQQMVRQWGSVLDLIVWLDAPDSVLAERINRRDQRHAVKGRAQAEVQHFLARYRVAYQDVLERLATMGGPMVVRYDTSQLTIDQVCDNILTVCHQASDVPLA